MNFALILFLLTAITGAVWLADRLLFAARRAPGTPDPIWVEYSKSFFPVLLVVFVLRSFLAEPFKIPSSSMRPTLEVGDFILVNKFIYGIRLPVIEQKIIPIGDPHRGDVVVFRYPLNPSQDFIKRVIGVGGDVVEYRDKQLTVNGKPWPQRADGSYSYLEGMRFETLERGVEETDGNPALASTRSASIRRRSPCIHPTSGSSPGAKIATTMSAASSAGSAGRIFHDGRQPGQQRRQPLLGIRPGRPHLRGKAFFIWFNWDDIASFAFKRVGSANPVSPAARQVKGETSVGCEPAWPVDTGFLFVAVVIIIFALVAFRVGPAYIEYFTVKRRWTRRCRTWRTRTAVEIRRAIRPQARRRLHRRGAAPVTSRGRREGNAIVATLSVAEASCT